MELNTNKKTNYRWIVCGFLWVAVAVNYVDRTALSAATPIIMKEFNIDGTEMGIIMAAFFWAYALLQVPMGYIADKFGQRIVYSIAVAWWSIAQMCIAVCSSLFGFVTARLFLGVGEAGSYPCNVGVVSKWFPKHERSRATAIFDSASKFGNAFAMPVVVGLITMFTWHAPFLIFGAIGIVWAILWWFFYNDPRKSKYTNKAEVAYIEQDGSAVIEDVNCKSTMKWYQLLKYRNVQAMCLGFFILNYILYFFITWFPTYLVEERGMQFSQMGMAASVPFIAAVCGSLIAGILADKLLMKGWSVTKTRKTLLVIGILLATSVGFAAFVESNVIVIALLAVANFGCAVTGAMQWCLASDVAPKNMSSQLAGIQNCVANFGGVASPIIAGAILSATNSFQIALYTYGITAVIGALIYGCYLGKIEQIKVPEK